jgi:hypothetical protein
VPFSAVLRNLGKETGAKVTIRGELGNVQQQEFLNLPIPEGISRLAQNSNADLMVLYILDKEGNRYPREIWGFERNHIVRQSPPP